MKLFKSLIFILFFCFFNKISFTQGEAAVPFLRLNPSPSLCAMGATGSALPTDDPFAFLWNPAQLGYNSLHNNLAFIFYPSSVDWLPVFNLDFKLNALAFNLGYNFKDIVGFPISFGFGYSNPEFNYGEYILRNEQRQPIGTFDSKDSYNAYSFGLGMEYYVQLGLGYTIKNVTSNLAVGPIGEQEILGKAETTVNDFGILLNVPIVKLIDENLLLPLDEGLNGKPTFDFSLGYSKSNIGDEIEYNTFPDQADPLPRVDRTGYGFSAGFDLISKNLNLNMFTISFTSEAEDILVTRDENGNWEYQSTWSDLNFWKNVVMIEGDEDIVSRTGTKLEFVESFAYYFGHFSGKGYFYEPQTNGYEIRAKGLFKLWALWAKEPITDFFRDHFDIVYYNTNFFANHPFETNMTGLAFYINHLNELFE